MSKERIYKVTLNGEKSLVKTTSKAKAKNFMKRQFVAGLELEASVASQDDIVSLMTDGVIIKKSV